MKSILLVLLVVGAVALGVFWLGPSRKPAQTPAEIARLKTELAQKEQQIQQLESDQKRAEGQVRELAKLSDEIASQSLAREAALSNAVAQAATGKAGGTNGTAGEEGGGLGKMLAGMMKDPEMRKMIRDQQSMAMNQLYDPFVKRMNLTPEEAGKFKEILANSMEGGLEMASSMFGGGGATNRAELLKSVADQQKVHEAEMKTLLGEERYAQYQDYQQTVGERAQLNQFRQQFSGADGISEEQTETLLTMMREEKKNVAATTGTAFPGQNSTDMQAMLKEDQMQKLLAAQETVNQNVYARAGQVLTPSQLASFATYQTNQLQILRMGLNMARRFMGEGSEAAAPK